MIPVGGVVDVPNAKPGVRGVVGINAAYGIGYNNSIPALVIIAPSHTEIDRRNKAWNRNYLSLTLDDIDYAVKAAMCDGKGAAWTAAEQAAAKKRMGISDSGGSSSDTPYIWVYDFNLSPSDDGIFTFSTASLTCVYPNSGNTTFPQFSDIIFHQGYIYYDVVDSDSSNTVCQNRQRII